MLTLLALGAQTRKMVPLTPSMVNSTLRQHNAFGGPGRNLVQWPAAPAVFAGLQYADRIDCPNRLLKRPEQVQIDQRLEIDLPVIAYVDASAKEPGLQQHFVLIVGQQSETGIYLINDPWHNDLALLCPRYGATPARAIAGLILYDRFAA